jgi:hypothetical protein
MADRILVGWKAIAGLVGLDVRTLTRERLILEELGVVFHMWRGKPPKRRVCAFESSIKAWIVARSKEMMEPKK